MPAEQRLAWPSAEKEPVERGQILNRYWQLANLDPEVTKGTITGQLKALDSLGAALGLTASEAGNPTAPAAPDIYRAAWMTPTEDDRENA